MVDTRAAALVDLCQWAAIQFADDRAMMAALRRHAEYHERRALIMVIVRAILIRASRLGAWSRLTEREREILRAYSAGADLPV